MAQQSGGKGFLSLQLSAGKKGNNFQMFRRQERRSGSPWAGQLKGKKILLTLCDVGLIKVVLAVWGQLCPTVTAVPYPWSPGKILVLVR